MDLAAILYEAAHAPLGIIVRESGGRRDLLKQKLYAERKKLADPTLDCITMTEDPDDDLALLLIKKGTKDD